MIDAEEQYSRFLCFLASEIHCYSECFYPSLDIFTVE